MNNKSMNSNELEGFLSLVAAHLSAWLFKNNNRN